MKLKYFRFAIFILLLQIILSLYIGMSLPEDARIPTHWNLKGEIDGWSSKWFGILLFPGVNLFLILLAVFFPKLSPRFRNDPERFQKILPWLITILVFFFALIHIYSLLIAQGTLPVKSNFIIVALGLMFICIGFLLPKIPSNFYMGVRLPWTLSSEYVWKRTHQLAGWSFWVGGLIMVVIGFTKTITLLSQILLITALVLIIAVPVISAYIFYKKEERNS